jgi:hypothetical protein
VSLAKLARHSDPPSNDAQRFSVEQFLILNCRFCSGRSIVESAAYEGGALKSPVFMRVERANSLQIHCYRLFLKPNSQILGRIRRFLDRVGKIHCKFRCSFPCAGGNRPVSLGGKRTHQQPWKRNTANVRLLLPPRRSPAHQTVRTQSSKRQAPA